MVLNLFKSGDELYDKGVDLVKRKEYSKARDVFQKAIDKESQDSKMAKVQIALIDLYERHKEAGAYENAANVMEQSGVEEFEFGITDIVTAKFIVECRLAAECVRIMSKDGDAAFREEKGKKLMELAQKYQIQIGKDNLKFNEMFRNDTTTSGVKEGMTLMAIAHEILASAYVLTDPKKAAEMLQTAYNYRRQIGDSGDEDLNLMKCYSKSATCWLCGRTATGEGVHFVSMSSDITPMMRGGQDEMIRSAPETFESIYVCRPCYSAVSRRADAIANDYHQKAMAEMRAMEARLHAEIAALQMYNLRR